jgi:DNA-binding response OmpR family regulator
VSRILLADDSPHAQRMGERILTEEGFEVVTVTDGETALLRLADADPDVILVDVGLPVKSGYEVCRYVKAQPRHSHTRVVLLASPLEPVDEAAAREAGADGCLEKPLEASALLQSVRALAEVAQSDRARLKPEEQGEAIDSERVRAAVTLALDAALPAIIDEVTERVLVALEHPSR